MAIDGDDSSVTSLLDEQARTIDGVEVARVDLAKNADDALSKKPRLVGTDVGVGRQHVEDNVREG